MCWSHGIFFVSRYEFREASKYLLEYPCSGRAVCAAGALCCKGCNLYTVNWYFVSCYTLLLLPHTSASPWLLFNERIFRKKKKTANKRDTQNSETRISQVSRATELSTTSVSPYWSRAWMNRNKGNIFYLYVYTTGCYDIIYLISNAFSDLVGDFFRLINSAWYIFRVGIRCARYIPQKIKIN